MFLVGLRRQNNFFLFCFYSTIAYILVPLSTLMLTALVDVWVFFVCVLVRAYDAREDHALFEVKIM